MIVTLQTGVQTLADVRAVIDGNDRLDYQFTDREAAYEFIRRTLVRFNYPTLSKPDGHRALFGEDDGAARGTLFRWNLTVFDRTIPSTDCLG